MFKNLVPPFPYPPPEGEGTCPPPSGRRAGEGDPLRHSLAHPLGEKVKVTIFLEI